MHLANTIGSSSSSLATSGKEKVIGADTAKPHYAANLKRDESLKLRHGNATLLAKDSLKGPLKKTTLLSARRVEIKETKQNLEHLEKKVEFLSESVDPKQNESNSSNVGEDSVPRTTHSKSRSLPPSTDALRSAKIQIEFQAYVNEKDKQLKLIKELSSNSINQ